MPSYTFLLVVALAASTVTPVLSVDAPEPPKEKEGRASSHLEPVERGLISSSWNNLSTKNKVILGGGASWLLFIGAVCGIAHLTRAMRHHNSTNVDPTNTTQATPTPTSTDTTQPSNVPRAISGQGERPLGHRLPVDNSKAREFLDNNDLDRRTSPHLDLLSRADLEDALSIFSRMLDRLD